MIANYIPLDKIPEEVLQAAETLNNFFESQGMKYWEFSYVADRRLVSKLERENKDLLEKLNENTP